jgi:hypothetical protein
MVDLNDPGPFPSHCTWGDVINVTASFGNMVGWNEGIAFDPGNEAFLNLNVTLTPTSGTAYYSVTLKVTDTIGQTNSVSKAVIVAPLPISTFTYTVSGAMVYVDASGSSASAGIVSYTWDWGDGTVPEVLTVPTAEHTYGGTLSAVSASTESIGPDIVIEPDTIYGYTYAADGTLLPDCDVTVTNIRSGDVVTTVSDSEYAFYMVSLYYDYPGDVIQVTAVKGGLSGTNSGVIDYGGGFALLQLDVYLLAGPGHVLTLTVTDTLGQTSTMTQLVLI